MFQLAVIYLFAFQLSILDVLVQSDVQYCIIHDLTQAYSAGHGSWPAQKNDVPIRSLCKKYRDEICDSE